MTYINIYFNTITNFFNTILNKSKRIFRSTKKKQIDSINTAKNAIFARLKTKILANNRTVYNII